MNVMREIGTVKGLPQLAARKINQQISSFRNGSYNPDGLDIPRQDWDNLIILDACRYDLYDTEMSMPGKVRPIQSRGADTHEWLRGNFGGGEFHDIVYITANPKFAHHDIDASFHAVENIWQGSGWSKEHKTVLPETLTEAATELAADYPEKRLLIHFVQPHHPFIDSDTTSDKTAPDGEGLSLWMQLMTDQASDSVEELWEAYRDNLRRALPSVEQLHESLSGKTIVSSDHGNLFGEHAGTISIREFGHPPGVYADELVTVPWHTLPYDDRRTIVREAPKSRGREKVDDDTEERLSHLGYR